MSGVGRRVWAAVAVTLSLTAGCREEPPGYIEVARIDEVVSESDLRAFLRVVQALPERRLPDWPTPLVPPPQWSHERTLPVAELVREEQTLLDERWSPDALAACWQSNLLLQQALRREGLTPQQFAGLALALGAALSRSTLRDAQDLDALVQRGAGVVARLERDTRPFSDHPLTARHRVLRDAAWLTRAARARRLRDVPPENVALVRQHGADLQTVFPEEFRRNPFDAIADPLDEFGVPFVELPDSGSDERIEWSPDEALIGLDPPDAE